MEWPCKACRARLTAAPECEVLRCQLFLQNPDLEWVPWPGPHKLQSMKESC